MYVLVIVVSFVVLLLGGLIGFLGFPLVFKELVTRSVHLRPGSETRQVWEKLPFPMTYKLYAFNVTNPEEVQAGGKPHLQQVGPLVFEEWKDKFDLLDDEVEDTLSYSMRNTFHLRPELGLSGDQLLTMPHPLLQFLSIASLAQPAEAQAAIAMGLVELLQPESAFITASFMELFFTGIDIGCDLEESQSSAALAICQQLAAGAVPGAKAVNATHYKFSLMGAGNHSNAGNFKVARGRSRGHTVGRVLQFNGQDELHHWQLSENGSSNSCNLLHGTDGTIFAPFMRPQTGLWSYVPQLCRSLSPKYVGKTQHQQLPAQLYELSLGSPRLEPELSCYCENYPEDCPADGTMELTRCNGSPLLVSLPHFYGADPKLLEQVDGLRPAKELHASTLIFEQISGTVLAVANRLQFSLQMMPVPQLELMSQLSTLSLPLFWFEESLELGEQVTAVLQQKIFGVLRINNIFRWLAIAVGGLGCLLGVGFLQLSRTDAKRVGDSGEEQQQEEETVP